LKEESVFWLGGRPATKADAAAPPEAQRLEPAVMAACRAHGLVPGDFVAALGGYGSWLVHFERSEHRGRIVWNGREGKLVLQAALRSGGWADVHECPVDNASESAFVQAIAALLATAPTPPA
jgi:hypothetical protein